MIKEFSQLLQQYVNKEHDELVFVAKETLKTFLPYCRKVDTKYDGQFLITCILIAGVTADGNFSQKEKQFICDVMGASMEDLDGFRDSYDPRLRDDIDKFADSLPEDVQTDLVLFLITVCACDETITRNETEFLLKLMA